MLAGRCPCLFCLRLIWSDADCSVLVPAALAARTVTDPRGVCRVLCCVMFGMCMRSLLLRSSHLRDKQVGNPLGSFQRSSPFLQSPIFNLYHSEHEMLRYLKRLENRCAAGPARRACAVACIWAHGRHSSV